MFECVRRGKSRDVISFGGRYDSLLEHFKEPAQQMPSRRVFGVGMSIAVECVVLDLERFTVTVHCTNAPQSAGEDGEEVRVSVVNEVNGEGQRGGAVIRLLDSGSTLS
jgi:histidyl-tRNA synthetase